MSFQRTGWKTEFLTGGHTVLVSEDRTRFLFNLASNQVCNLPQASLAGAGFEVQIKVQYNSSGKVSVDPFGAELVEGVATIGLLPEEDVHVVCDGTEWHLV